MSTIINALQKGSLPEAVEVVAGTEGIPRERLVADIIEGKTVVPLNTHRKGRRPVGIGAGLRTKVNANIGTSEHCTEIAEELSKLDSALKSGADAIMDLSTGGDIDAVRLAVIDKSDVPVGTVPIYQAATRARQEKGGALEMSPDDLFAAVEAQAKDGVDFMTIHAGVTSHSIELLKTAGRVTDVVSRGGALTLGWMLQHGKENPFYDQFDRLLGIASEHDVTLSLGDGMRPGCLADASDALQIQELVILGTLARRAREAGVQVMIEGPGHVPLNEITANVLLEKKICDGAPFYVLGPLVTDIAPGYDHITSAIGGAIAASAGADFLCYVTPSEHLGLPTASDVRDGVIAARIAAHAADIVKGVPGARSWDLDMARARKALDWEKQAELAIDPEKARRVHGDKLEPGETVCTMCGNLCAMKLVSEFFGWEKARC